MRIGRGNFMKKLCFIIDTSGSMGVPEKISLSKYILNALDGIMKREFLNVPYEYYQWGKEMKKVMSFIDIKFDNSNLNYDISKFLQEESNSKMLFVSDGNFTFEDQQKISSLINYHKIDACALAVGSDKNIATLRNIFGRENVFNTSDLVTGIKILYCR